MANERTSYMFLILSYWLSHCLNRNENSPSTYPRFVSSITIYAQEEKIHNSAVIVSFYSIKIE